MVYYEPADKNAIEEVKNVLRYLCGINGRMILTGQHTQTMAQEERCKILEVTGKEPALLGFELLAYSPNINYNDTDEECMTEVELDRGTLEKAWEWAEKGGLITFTWHWFSPIGGRSKAFYSKFTDFDPDKALVQGTDENRALISDMDAMAELLRPFCEKHIPILWRPFHESEGDWFWWGSKGPETAGKLFRLMFEHFTVKHELHNLIWVWNCPLKKGYPGDDVVDMISRDLYPKPYNYTSHKKEYDELKSITLSDKLAAIAEIGVLPDPEKAIAENAAWSYYMTWSNIFCLGEKFSTYEKMKKIYESEYSVTLDKLPKLYDPASRK